MNDPDDDEFWASREANIITTEDIERERLRLSMTESEWAAFVLHGQRPLARPAQVDSCRACAGSGERPYYETPSGPARWDICISCNGSGGR